MDLDRFEVFTLVLFRMSGLFLSAPLFGSRDIPVPVKAGFSALCALVVLPYVPFDPAALPRDLGPYVAFVAAELGVGLTLGFAASLFFSAFQLAGQHVGQQMGLGMADVIDPFSESEVSVIGQIQFFIALFVWSTAGGHRMLLEAVAGSFGQVPLGAFRPTPVLVGLLSDSFGGLLALSFKIAAPALAALFLSTVALGFVARAVPQMNVLLLSFPLQIGLGMGVLVWTLPAAVGFMLTACGGLAGGASRLLAAMVPHG